MLFPVLPFQEIQMEVSLTCEGHSMHNWLLHPLLLLVFCFFHLVIHGFSKPLEFLDKFA